MKNIFLHIISLPLLSWLQDLHRTGCSLFCGEDAEENQLMLKRVLLAYARWNKAIGYCQGFNMLAAIILEVMEKSETDALKVRIDKIERQKVIRSDQKIWILVRMSQAGAWIQLKDSEGR